MISVRLDMDTEKHLDRVASLLGLSRSELIRKAIEKYLEKYERPSPWELGEKLFGRHGSGRTDRAEDFTAQKTSSETGGK